jgi:hypothetical protein
MLIPPAAFIGWIMLQQSSVFDSVQPRFLSDFDRKFIPTVGAIVSTAAAAGGSIAADRESTHTGRRPERANTE